jgi:hypothetical protein
MDKAERFDRFNDEAKQTLRLAHEEAQHFNHNYIGTEHLLLGLVRQEGSLAAQVLESLDIELGRVRGAVEFIIGRGDRVVLGEIGLTPRSKKVIELSIVEAERMNQKEIGPEHILLGLIREGEGIAAGVLESLGVTLWRLRKATLEAMGLPTADMPPEPTAFRLDPRAAFTLDPRTAFRLDPHAAFSTVPALPLMGLSRYQFHHIDAEQRERRPVGSGANPRPIPAAPYSAVFGTRVGWVVINTGGAFTLRLYDGLTAAEPFAIIANPPTSATFPYHFIVKQGLTYLLEGTPGSITVLYEDMER